MTIKEIMTCKACGAELGIEDNTGRFDDISIPVLHCPNCGVLPENQVGVK